MDSCLLIQFKNCNFHEIKFLFSRANTVYGLGFSSEPELNKFIEKFGEVKEATRSGKHMLFIVLVWDLYKTMGGCIP